MTAASDAGHVLADAMNVLGRVADPALLREWRASQGDDAVRDFVRQRVREAQTALSGACLTEALEAQRTILVLLEDEASKPVCDWQGMWELAARYVDLVKTWVLDS